MAEHDYNLHVVIILGLIASFGGGYLYGYGAGMDYQPFEGGFACPAYDLGLLDGYDAALADYNITPEEGIPQLRARDIREKLIKYDIEMDY